MPLVTTERINADPAVLAEVAQAVVDGKTVAYQFIGKKIFVYRVPTFGELLRLEIAEAQDPSAAAHAFLNRILIGKMPRLRISDIQPLVASIIKDHFPDGESGLTMDLRNTTGSSMTTMVGVLGANLMDLSPDIRIEDLDYHRVLDMLSKKQMILQQPILPGSMPASPKRRKRGNPYWKALDPKSTGGPGSGPEAPDQPDGNREG